jgi:hypothetical protein
VKAYDVLPTDAKWWQKLTWWAKKDSVQFKIKGILQKNT